MLKTSLFAFLIATSASAGFAQANGNVHQPTLTPQKSGTTQLLIAVSPVNSQVVWAAGFGGTYVVTTDGGNTWKAAVVPGAEKLQFRDVYAVSDKIAYLLSVSGASTPIPTEFRIYKTTDGGATWTIEFTNHTVNAFYDCFAFWSPTRGIAHSDSVNGVFPDLRTEDGVNWHSLAGVMPPALTGEASFAASGTCAATEGEGNAWIATGGSSAFGRILATTNGGGTWHAYNTPFKSSSTAGAISVAFRDCFHGVVGGGDLLSDSSAETATSGDGGQTWTLTKKPPVAGAIFCLSYARGKLNGTGAATGHEYDRTVVITSETAKSMYGAGDAAWTPDEGQTWFTLSGVSGYWAVGFADPTAGWFVGNKGKILKISF